MEILKEINHGLNIVSLFFLIQGVLIYFEKFVPQNTHEMNKKIYGKWKRKRLIGNVFVSVGFYLNTILITINERITIEKFLVINLLVFIGFGIIIYNNKKNIGKISSCFQK